MMTMQGDPALSLGPDGSDLTFTGGQPAMDRGLTNFVLISLFTASGWVGNKLLAEPIESDFEEACNQPITRRALNQIRNAAERALAHPLLGQVTITVSNPVGHRLLVGVQLTDGRSVELTRDNGAWRIQ